MRPAKGIWSICIVLALLSSCSEKKGKPVIAISKFYPNNDYQHWVHTQDTNFRFKELYSTPIDSLEAVLSSSSGLILTGGPDVAPSNYGASDSLSLCGKPDLLRDSIELKAIQYILNNNLPTIAVCRGMQLTNIALRGSLTMDIPANLGSQLHQKGDGKGGDAFHNVYTKGEFLRNLSGVDSSEVNSNHHQCIDQLGEGLIIEAISVDSVVESVSLSNPDASFFIGVQWHPERMDPNAPLSYPILKALLNAINDGQNHH